MRWNSSRASQRLGHCHPGGSICFCGSVAEWRWSLVTGTTASTILFQRTTLTQSPIKSGRVVFLSSVRAGQKTVPYRASVRHTSANPRQHQFDSRPLVIPIAMRGRNDDTDTSGLVTHEGVTLSYAVVRWHDSLKAAIEIRIAEVGKMDLDCSLRRSWAFLFGTLDFRWAVLQH